MESTLPFRHEEETCYLSKVHPIINFIIPFIIVIPFLIINDIYLILTIILITLIIDLTCRMKILRIFSRIKLILPFMIIMTIFIPFYIGSTIIFRIGVIPIYMEGLYYSLLLFLRIMASIFVFLSLLRP